MVQGNFARGEYWIDCNHVSESVLRPLFGAWVTLCVAAIAVCARTVYRSRIKCRLLSNNHDERFVSLWDVSPANNPAEVFELRRILVRWAQAPLDQLFDFTPDDTSDWLYVPEEWNNTWTGTCAFHTYQAVDLVVYPSNSSSFQDEVPTFGAYLPAWATLDPTRQATMYSGFRHIVRETNDSGAWRDNLVSYIFGSSPVDNVDPASTINISFANFLAHHVGRDLYSNGFEETALRSDVHVVECTLVNSHPGIEDQAFAECGEYPNALTTVAGVYARSVTDASVNQQPVVQPTGQEMFRNWQAFICTCRSNEAFRAAHYRRELYMFLARSCHIKVVRTTG
ncbi:hypothetical protein BD410DRAFT_847076 [Rickenella mellea]|uniref:Uncharacterized protein n=1 Tax=Rickenella mellea TaxID=50990 RepID=A0A4Y7PDL1_9AGAM|nr:hypothetical protein BD410DRAFT_847076 [Rickenella mellea]